MATVDEVVAAWFAAVTEGDEVKRRELLEVATTDDVVFQGFRREAGT